MFIQIVDIYDTTYITIEDKGVVSEYTQYTSYHGSGRVLVEILKIVNPDANIVYQKGY